MSEIDGGQDFGWLLVEGAAEGGGEGLGQVGEDVQREGFPDVFERRIAGDDEDTDIGMAGAPRLLYIKAN